MDCDGVVLGEIFHSPRMSCRLGWYPPFYRQSRHAHSDAQVSILLSGEFRERACRREISVEYCGIAAKPRGAEHSVVFGPNGALILSFDLSGNPPDEGSEPVIAGETWGWRESSRIGPLLAELSRHLSGPDVQSMDEVENRFWDIVSLQDQDCNTRPRHANSPPSWLLRLKQELDDAPERLSVGAAACAAGYHRTHVARMFNRYFGVSVSAYRRRSLAGAAVKYLADGATPIAASCNAGFADQSHMTRVVKSETGFTPGVLRRLLFDASRAA